MLDAQQAIERMEAAGMTLAVDGDRLILDYQTRPTSNQQAWIKDHKSELVETLKARMPEQPHLSAEDTEDLAEAREERSAICEYDGGLSRKEADAEAAKIRAWSVLVAMPDGDPRPPRWVSMICTGDRDQARSKAIGTFTASRVLDVREGTT